MSSTKKQKRPSEEAPPPARPSLWRRGIHVENVVLIAAVAFVVGVLVGRTSQVRSHLAAGSVDPHAGLDLSSSEDPHAGLDVSSSEDPHAGLDLSQAAAMDQSAVKEALEAARKEVEGVSDLEALVHRGNEAFDQAEKNHDPRLYFQAIAAYERALQVRPGDPNVQTDLGIAYRGIGQPDAAIEHFQAAQASDPTHLQSVLNLAVVYLEDKGEPEKAAEAAEQCLSLDPPEKIAATAQEILTAARQKMK
jgi:tetratricopeptide (TPR) repeat protein